MKVKKGVILQKMGESYVAFDNATSTLHELNETAYFILEKIEKGRTAKEIIKYLKKSFKTSKVYLEKDYNVFIEILAKKDLIVGKK